MMITSPQSQLLEWLKEQLAMSEAKLIEAQNSFNYFKQKIELESSSNLSKDMSVSNTSDNLDSAGTVLVEPRKQSENSVWTKEKEGRTAKEMLLPEYAGLTIGEAIFSYMGLREESVNLDEMVDDMFELPTQEELKRVKQCLNNEMQKGKKEDRWENVSRGRWGLISLPEKESDDEPLPVLEAVVEIETITNEDSDDSELRDTRTELATEPMF